MATEPEDQKEKNQDRQSQDRQNQNEQRRDEQGNQPARNPLVRDTGSVQRAFEALGGLEGLQNEELNEKVQPFIDNRDIKGITNVLKEFDDIDLLEAEIIGQGPMKFNIYSREFVVENPETDITQENGQAQQDNRVHAEIDRETNATQERGTQIGEIPTATVVPQDDQQQRQEENPLAVLAALPTNQRNGTGERERRREQQGRGREQKEKGQHKKNLGPRR